MKLLIYICFYGFFSATAFGVSSTDVERAASFVPSIEQNDVEFLSLSEEEFNQDPKKIQHFLREASNFVIPNEHRPQDAQAIWNAIPKDTGYVAVGSERGFIAAGLVGPSSLTLFDFNKSVFVFNVANTLLLQAATNRAHYLHLRLEANITQWQQAMPHVPAHWVSPLFDFWQRVVRHTLTKEGSGATPNTSHLFGFQLLHTPPHLMAKPAFGLANYLYSESAFKNLQKLAQANRIHPLLGGDVSSPQDTAAVVSVIAKSGEKIGALDFSNVVPFIEFYGDRKGYQECRRLWNQVLHPNGFVIATIPEDEWDVGLESGEPVFATYWHYVLEEITENTRP